MALLPNELKIMKTIKKQRKQKIFCSIMIPLFIFFIIVCGHSITFDLEDNNCTHMSRRLERIIERVGIPVTLRTGGASDGSRHMWIKLWGWLELDSVNLLPVVNTENNQHMVEYESFDKYENK